MEGKKEQMVDEDIRPDLDEEGRRKVCDLYEEGKTDAWSISLKVRANAKSVQEYLDNLDMGGLDFQDEEEGDEDEEE